MAEITSSHPRTPRKVFGFQLKIMVLFFVVGVVNSLDRATLSVANPLIRQDLHVSVSQMGLLLSAFFWVYAWAQLPLGPVIDRVTPRKVLGVSVIFWSLMQGIAGAVTGFWSLFGARMALGAGEAPQLPCSAGVARTWFRVHQRGLPMGVLTGALQVATALGVPVLTYFMLAFGWRNMFWGMGVLGVIVGTAWIVVYREPKQAGITPADQAFLLSDEVDQNLRKMTWGRWFKLIRCRTTLGVIFGFVGYLYLDAIYRVWLPGYLEIQHHLSIGKTGLVAAIPMTCGVLGSICGGVFADLLARRSVSAFNSGKTICIVGTGIMALTTLGLAFSNTLMLALVLLSVASWASHMSGSAAWVFVAAAAPKDAIGSLGGLQNCVGFNAGAVASIVTGFLVQSTGSFSLPLLVGGIVAVLAVLVYIFVPRRPITSDDLEPRATLATVAA